MKDLWSSQQFFRRSMTVDWSLFQALDNGLQNYLPLATMNIYSADGVKVIENKLLSFITGTMKVQEIQIHPTSQGILVSNETARQVAFLGRTADSSDDGIFSWCFFMGCFVNKLKVIAKHQ